jgi:cysteine synthase
MKEPIDRTIHEDALRRNVQRAREREILLPTFEQMKHPEQAPPAIRQKLRLIGLWDIDPANLFRITWKNEPMAWGGGFQDLPNYLEIPPAISGVSARILAMTGKYFPTGAHKVGATYACLVPRLVTGQFDSTYHQAVWPSTGNYCRGGAYNATLLGCRSIAILPERMSRERFDWLKSVAGEVIATPGCESNVKEIFDKTNELERSREDVMVFNQFGELGNHLWHYEVTGNAMLEMIEHASRPGDRVAGVCLASGSAGTLGSADKVKERYPGARLAVAEAAQCPTLLRNGFGDHRIEGIGDKHVPWIHDVKNTDMIVDVDDEDCMSLFRLLSEDAGQAYLETQGVDGALLPRLSWAGISGAANLLACIKFARYYELGPRDILVTVLTDSAEMYRSRLTEMEEERGRRYDGTYAARDHERIMHGIRTDEMEELTYWGRKRIHQLKYYTWIEQQGYPLEELNAQWDDHDEYWGKLHGMTAELDRLIVQFNDQTGLDGGSHG